MKTIVIIMIIIILGAGVFIANGGFTGDQEYCAKAEAARNGEYTGEYKGRFDEFLHGCW